jgi:signal transduction histidine kinase
VKNEIDSEMPIPNLDKDQFRPILINLVQNAVEAMPPEQEGTVSVRAQGGAGHPFRIMVADDGAGIPEEIASKIFQPLFTTKTKGTGLGLAVVASVVERHHGTIQLESAPGEGATFIIELPPNDESKAA